MACIRYRWVNTDQGSQFTNEAFTGVLKRAGAVISMDEYIRLKERVESRMMIADVTATGDDNVLSAQANDVAYRKEQLRRASKSRVDSLFRLAKLAPWCKTWRAWKTLSWSAFW